MSLPECAIFLWESSSAADMSGFLDYLTVLDFVRARSRFFILSRKLRRVSVHRIDYWISLTGIMRRRCCRADKGVFHLWRTVWRFFLKVVWCWNVLATRSTAGACLLLAKYIRFVGCEKDSDRMVCQQQCFLGPWFPAGRQKSKSKFERQLLKCKGLPEEG